MSIVVTGGTGLLGVYLMNAARTRGPVNELSRHGRYPCDLTDPKQTKNAIRELAPDIVIHAAAMTDVDACERCPIEADLLNRQATSNLVTALPEYARLLYVSTDQVYPDVPGPHREDDVGPVNVYGRSKRNGEDVALTHSATLVLRTSFFAPSRSPKRQSFSDFIVSSLSTQRTITLFQDVLFSPLHISTLVESMFELLDMNIRGVLNVGSRDGMSKLDFGRAVAAHLRLQTETIIEGRSDAIVGRAPRPLDLRLDLGRLENVIGQRMPTLEEEISKL